VTEGFPWKIAGTEEPQGALFEQPVFEREVGIGEYRGLEFLHVRAKRIVNTLRDDHPLPFRHTVNVFRGCSNRCSYCFARPTHQYLGMDMGDDFDSKIVVKVNAVSQLARELDPRRWKGEPIAMGTNTDPYQRAEGKYRLTRGVVELLSARRNPFSILTKSTLVLRDLDLLAEATRRTDVRVNLSIGTLDEDVWKATEPGTPHPAQRIKAVAALHDAGIPCGVLVAPVIPGLSDGEEQLRAVATAAAEAGAQSVSTVGLHLRHGVGAVFLERLATTHPQVAADLAVRYERRVNLAKADQERISGVVGVAVRRAGRRLAHRYDHRHLAAGAPAPPTPPTPAEPVEQLTLLA
jgi:DNA repair photolyase